LKVLGDYGILPTYAFPIYVDELRLNEILTDSPPRCDLEFTRDRRISLVEYYPGRTVQARADAYDRLEEIVAEAHKQRAAHVESYRRPGSKRALPC
jgi:hypothetical protein